MQLLSVVNVDAATQVASAGLLALSDGVERILVASMRGLPSPSDEATGGCGKLCR